VNLTHVEVGANVNLTHVEVATRKPHQSEREVSLKLTHVEVEAHRTAHAFRQHDLHS
jgi:hypothetical protein